MNVCWCYYGMIIVGRGLSMEGSYRGSAVAIAIAIVIAVVVQVVVQR